MAESKTPSATELAVSEPAAPEENNSPTSTAPRSSEVKFDEPEAEESDLVTTMAPSMTEQTTAASETRTAELTKKNPFIMPPDHEIFLLRDKERQRKKQERIRQRKLHVHEKTTFSSRVNCRPAAMIHPTPSDVNLLQADKAAAAADDIKFTLAITRDRHVEKESLAEYIAKKREMFLVQYSLGVKRDEMRKLEEIAQAEERKLELAEQFLEEDASMFDDFLKENDKNSVEAIKVAESEAKSKMDRMNEIKKIQISIMSIKSDMSKYDEKLKEYKTYKEFLDNITPLELIPESVLRARKRSKMLKKQGKGGQAAGSEASSVSLVEHAERPKKSQRQPSMAPRPRRGSIRISHVRKSSQSQYRTSFVNKQFTDSETEEPEKEPEKDLNLFFKDPQQVLDIFADLEEQNLSLIQNSQETEETLEEVKQTMKATRKKMTQTTKSLKEQIDKLQTAVKREKGKAKQFKMKAKLFTHGGEEGGDKEPVSLDAVVMEVYRSCIEDNYASMSALQMLTTIENRVEELFDIIETIPPQQVEAAEKMKEKERRLKMREEKLVEQRLYQEERVRHALERAKAEPKRMTGRRLVFRSQPPKMKTVKDDSEEQARIRAEEEFNYYFTWQ